ncbi:MAG: signal peptidase I [Bacillota bacterium]|jgi:signal peptidase I
MNKTATGKEQRKSFIKEIIVVVLIALAISCFLKFFIMDSRMVPTPSMYPTIHVGDRVLVNKLAYFGDRSPQRGDIVVFVGPADSGVDGDLLKRVLGLPGEKIEVHDKKVYINDQPLTEDYLAEEPYYDFGPVIVPEGYYFMMGDNRNQSADSHYWQDPFISKKDIKGKAFVRYWPFNRISVLEKAVY